MKVRDIIAMRESGVLEATSHNLNSKDAYKVFKLKKEVSNALTEIGEKEKSLFTEAGIEDPNAFISEFNSLRSKENPDSETLKDYNNKWIRVNELLNAMHDDEMTINLSPITYDSWRELQNENKEIKSGDRTLDVFSGYIEMLLEDIFWKAPTDDE